MKAVTLRREEFHRRALGVVGDADGVALVREMVPEGADEVLQAGFGDIFADFLGKGGESVVELAAAVVGGEVVEGGGEFGGHGFRFYAGILIRNRLHNSRKSPERIPQSYKS